MSKGSAVVGNREILLVAETIAQEKGITLDDVIGAMEEGLRLAARKKYGHDLSVECIVDRKTGKITLYNKIEIVNDEEIKNPEFNPKKQITLDDAKNLVKSKKAVEADKLKEGGFLRVELPPIDLSRIIVQIAKNEIIKRVKEAERDKEFNEFKDRVGSLINGFVKKIGLKNIVVDIDGYESLLPNNHMVPGERFKVGNRIRAFIADVRKEKKGAQIFLSRTDVGFVKELFKQEVPEIYDNIIEIKAIAREPGSRTKIAVYSRDENSDVVGTCIGVRGSRVQAVISELNGEKIDIIKWTDNLPELVVNTLKPAKISKVVFDEDKETLEVVVAEDQLSLAIGRGGQNVKLASKIVGYRIDIMTEEDERKKRIEEFNETSKLFIEELDLEEVMGQLLTAEGYYSIEGLAEASIDELQSIEGFNEEIAQALKERAEEWVKNKEKEEVEKTEEKEEEPKKEEVKEEVKEEKKEKKED